jgi:hypothetical protein
MEILAVVKQGIICLPDGSHLPDGTRVIIESVESPVELKESRLGRKLQQFVGVADDLPSDLARNHDHYLHGQGK